MVYQIIKNVSLIKLKKLKKLLRKLNLTQKVGFAPPAWWWRWWWWWIVFAEWLTDARRLVLFPAGTIARNTHHRKSPTHCEQDLNFRRILSWGFGEWSCVVVTTTTPRRHSIAGVTHGATRAPSHRTSTINKIIFIKCPFPLHSQISIFLASTV